MNLREAAQQALEVFERMSHEDSIFAGEFDGEIAALRAALAEPEPVMHQYKYQAYGYYKEDGKLKLGTIPEPQTTHWEGCEAVHPECRKPEPVAAWENKYGMKEWEVHAIRAGWMPAPTPRKPLTDDEIGKIAGDTLDPWSCARAIEKAHGIGEQHE